MLVYQRVPLVIHTEEPFQLRIEKKNRVSKISRTTKIEILACNTFTVECRTCIYSTSPSQGPVCNLTQSPSSLWWIHDLEKPLTVTVTDHFPNRTPYGFSTSRSVKTPGFFPELGNSIMFDHLPQLWIRLIEHVGYQHLVLTKTWKEWIKFYTAI